MTLEIATTGLIAFFMFVALHYFKWPQVFSVKEVRPPWSYMAGVGGLGICYSMLMVHWHFSQRAITPVVSIVAFWVVISMGGGAVLMGYLIDALLESRARKGDLQMRRIILERRYEEGQEQAD